MCTATAEDSPQLYDRRSGLIKLRVEILSGSEAASRKGAVRYDLPRDAKLQAILGDSRNDENVTGPAVRDAWRFPDDRFVEVCRFRAAVKLV